MKFKMIYIYRTLLALGYIPMLIVLSVIFGLTLITWPVVMGIYYIIKGEIETIKYNPATIPEYISKQCNKLADLIEKYK